MELVETVIENQISEYELERGKPMPTLLHGVLQGNIIFELKLKYQKKYTIGSEVSLETQPNGTTPDLVLYPKTPLDYKNDPAKRTDSPLLTIEIQSGSQSTKEMISKLEPYFSFGIKSCWIVVPELKAILVYDSPYHYDFFHENEILKDEVLGIEMDLGRVFE